MGKFTERKRLRLARIVMARSARRRRRRVLIAPDAPPHSLAPHHRSLALRNKKIRTCINDFYVYAVDIRCNNSESKDTLIDDDIYYSFAQGWRHVGLPRKERRRVRVLITVLSAWFIPTGNLSCPAFSCVSVNHKHVLSSSSFWTLFIYYIPLFSLSRPHYYTLENDNDFSPGLLPPHF